MLAPSYRPVTRPVPQTQPTNIALDAAGELVMEPRDLTVQTDAPRQTIFEDDFSSGYLSRHGYLTDPLNAFNASTMSLAHTTLLTTGDAIAVTWNAGALPGHRWGGLIGPAGRPYGELWFSYYFKFVSGFSPGGSLHGGKMPRLWTTAPINGGGAHVCADHGHQGRIMWRSWIDEANEILDLENYDWWPDDAGNVSRFPFSPRGVTVGETHQIEMYFKENSAHNVTDGKLITKLDGVVVNDFTRRFFCGAEGNRVNGRIEGPNYQSFYGGNNSNWSPANQSTLIYGPVKVEIPAP